MVRYLFYLLFVHVLPLNPQKCQDNNSALHNCVSGDRADAHARSVRPPLPYIRYRLYALPYSSGREQRTIARIGACEK